MLGLFGAGWQARGQLIAAANVRPLKRVHVYSRDAARRENFAAEMSGKLNIDVRAVDRPELAVVNLPLVITATTSRTPVFSGADLWPVRRFARRAPTGSTRPRLTWKPFAVLAASCATASPAANMKPAISSNPQTRRF